MDPEIRLTRKAGLARRCPDPAQAGFSFKRRGARDLTIAGSFKAGGHRRLLLHSMATAVAEPLRENCNQPRRACHPIESIPAFMVHRKLATVSSQRRGLQKSDGALYARVECYAP
jgi:hypothetical protein